MTPIQTIQIRMSETREKVNDLAAAESADDISRRDKLTAELKAQEAELRAAIEAEDADDTTSETREWADVSSRFDLGEMFTNVMEYRASAGAIAEVQKERGLAPNDIPTEMLMEKRAVTPAPGDVGQTQTAITGFVFPSSVAAFLGIPSPVVPVGDTTFPVLTSDPAAGTPAENAEQTETTGAFTADVLTPKRIQASFFWSQEDAARMAGMGDALRDALQSGMADKLDSEIMQGTNGLLTESILPEHNVTAATTWADYISDVAMKRVDGQYAASLSDLRIVMGTDSFAHAGSVYRATEADRTALERLNQLTGGVRVSKHVPAVANHRQNVLIRLGNRQDYVAPVWGAVKLIPDEITKASHGQIVLTAILLHAVKVLRVGGFWKQQIQTQ